MQFMPKIDNESKLWPFPTATTVADESSKEKTRGSVQPQPPAHAAGTARPLHGPLCLGKRVLVELSSALCGKRAFVSPTRHSTGRRFELAEDLSPFNDGIHDFGSCVVPLA